MARSLDELIEFLLGEIALSGEQGVTPKDIFGFVDDFYHHKPGRDEAAPDGAHSSNAGPFVDRRFREKVWKWLTGHSEVSVGRNRQGNKLTLAEVEARYQEPTSDNTNSPQVEQTLQHEESIANNGTLDSTVETQALKISSKASERPRIYASEHRMWLAICGHPQDHSRVFEREFELLSVVAPLRSQGINQGDLVRITGQDKRSVPKRTDALAKKGYIEKIPIHIRGNKTSRIVLKRFAGAADPKIFLDEEALQLEPLLKEFFELLRTYEVVTRDDLKAKLNMTTHWRSRVLARTIRTLETMGCVKRVRAAAEDETERLFQCVKYLRDLNGSEMKEIVGMASYMTSGSDGADETIDDDEEDQTKPLLSSDSPRVEELKRPVPQWNPDRVFANALLEVVQASGTRGVSTQGMKARTVGGFMSRPFIISLARHTTTWPTAQPVHLKDYSILRDANIEGTVAHFVHYTYPNFQTLVDQGVTFWEGVILDDGAANSKPTLKGKKQKPMRITSKPENSYVVDQFGFVVGPPPSHQFKHGQGTLGQIIKSTKAGKFVLARRDPIAYSVTPGNFELRYDDPKSRLEKPPRITIPEVISASRAIREKSKDPDQLEGNATVLQPVRVQKLPPGMSNSTVTLKKGKLKPKGRPKKFQAGTEPFWEGIFLRAKAKATGYEYPDDVPRAGVMKHPSGNYVFGKRPEKFDSVLLKAMKKKLPLPIDPNQINQEWIDLTQTFLNRSKPGLYLTPRGELQLSGGTGRLETRLMVLKSNRLRELDWTPRQVPAAVRFFSSSAAHTLSYAPYRVFTPKEGKFPLVDEMPIAKPSAQESAAPETSLPTAAEISPETMTIAAETVETRAENTATDAEANLMAPSANPKSSEKRKIGRPKGSSLAIKYTDLPPPITTRGERRRKAPVKISKPKIKVSASSQTPAVLPKLPSEAATSQTHYEEFASPFTAGSVVGGSSAHSSHLGAATSTISNIKIQTKDGELQSQKIVSDHLEANGNSMRQLPTNAANPGLNPNFPPTVDSAGIHGIEIISSSQPIPTVTVGEPNPEKSNGELPILQESNSYQEVDGDGKGAKVLGGSMAARRRMIIMSIIDRCHGAVPFGIYGLRDAFVEEWKKANMPSIPDVKTVRQVVKSLCDNGKLKQLKFSHKNKDGSMVMLTIVAKVELTILDPVLKEMQKKMMDLHPRPFIPPQLLPEKPDDSHSRPPVIPPPASWEVRIQNPDTRLSKTTERDTQSANKSRTENIKAYNYPIDVTRLQRIAGATPVRRFNVPSQRQNRPKLRGYVRRLKAVTHNASDLDISGSNFSPGESLSTSKLPNERQTGSSHRHPTTKILWATGQANPFPTSLNDLLGRTYARRRFNAPSDPQEAEKREFDSAIARVQRFEETNLALFQLQSDQHYFINHTFGEHESVSLEVAKIVFAESTRFHENGYREADRIQINDSNPSSPSVSSVPWGSYQSSPKTTPQPNVDGVRRGLRKRPGPKSNGPAGKRRKVAVAATGQDVTSMQHRGPQRLRRLSRDHIDKVMLAVVIVRTLAGGIEKYIEWRFVMQAFPDHETDEIQKQWKTMRNQYRREVNALTEDFSETFLAAYAANEVPTLDFENLHDTDWVALLDWAWKAVGKRSILPELPSTRRNVQNITFIDLPEPKPLRELHGYNVATTVPRKEYTHACTPFATVVEGSRPFLTPDLASTERLSKAKSWVRATIFTPSDRYDAKRASEKLLSLAPDSNQTDETLHAATKQLLAKPGTIVRNNKPIRRLASRTAPGDSDDRVYEMAASVMYQLDTKRLIQANMLKRAAYFKIEVLDSAFKESGTLGVDVSSAEEGDVLVVINLLAQQRLKLKAGADVPRSRYGPSGIIGYQTRFLQRDKLAFTVSVEPIEERYIYGCPVTIKPPVVGDVDGKIPTWVDIHGGLQEHLWDLVSCTIIGLIAGRPGIDVKELTASFGAVLMDWEVELIIEWLLSMEVVKKTGDHSSAGWEVREWWWLISSAQQ